MPIFDTHCHLDFSDFDSDRESVLARTKTSGVSDLLIPGVVRSTWNSLLDICKSETGLHPALGLHPVFLDRHSDSDINDLSDYIRQHQITAVGEIGLDFQIQTLDKNRQLVLFEKQLRIAVEADLPVILHVRKAHDQVLKLLKQYHPSGGICHAFNGSQQQAVQYESLGFKLGFGGMLTYERSSKLRALANALPMSLIVLETDAPDMTGAAHQYQRNSPEYLPEMVVELARIREISENEVIEATYTNACEVLRIN